MKNIIWGIVDTVVPKLKEDSFAKVSFLEDMLQEQEKKEQIEVFSEILINEIPINDPD